MNEAEKNRGKISVIKIIMLWPSFYYIYTHWVFICFSFAYIVVLILDFRKSVFYTCTDVYYVISCLKFQVSIWFLFYFFSVKSSLCVFEERKKYFCRKIPLVFFCLIICFNSFLCDIIILYRIVHWQFYLSTL